MPKIVEVIDRIAVLAEQGNYVGCLEDWSICGSFNPDYPPRLNLEQIQELTHNYPFHLPLELCELYQRGNGCLPIGVNPNKNWDSFDSYFQFEFLFGEDVFFPLVRAINTYCSLTSLLKNNKNKFQLLTKTRKQQSLFNSLLNLQNFSSRLFPISSSEDGLYVVLGNEVQQETSPIFFLYDDLIGISMKWPSLTSMMLAMADVMERKMLFPKPNEYEIEAIWHKYMEEEE